MTLVELLVVVVIATMLVVGVVPLLSPNNDARKIREASRELHTYITRAQAEAARTGRPYGIGFRETTADSGFALEAFMIAEPAPFAGFDDYSKVRLASPDGQGRPQELRFVVFDGTGYVADPLPPNFLRWGDVVEVDGIRYRINDKDQDGDRNDDDATTPPFQPGGFYTSSDRNTYDCEAEISGDRMPAVNYLRGGFSEPKSYIVRRQPTNTSAQPLSFPRGIGVDLVASGFDAVRFEVRDVDGNLMNTSPIITQPNALPVTNPAPPQFGRLLSTTWTQIRGMNPPPTPFPADVPLTIGIMFSPTGEVDSVAVNGERQAGYTKLFLLLGRVENAVTGLREAAQGDYTIVPDAANLTNVPGDNDLEEKLQEENNWLNLDSRWLVIAASTGRAVVGENRTIDMDVYVNQNVNTDGDNDDFEEDFDEQLALARSLAADMKRTGK
ncbi:MAG: hypothetical protein KDA44_23460 [Planctomycetales bacterium]|nr:hypothetical protein [Planctomycetales bacterium]